MTDTNCHDHDDEVLDFGDFPGQETAWEGEDGHFSEAEVESVVYTLYREALNRIFEIDELAHDGKMDKALRQIRKLTQESLEYLDEDPDLKQLSLSLGCEALVYPYLYPERKPQEKIVLLPVPLADMYCLWGRILLDLGKEEAGVAKLLRARQFNPLMDEPFAPLNRYYERHHKDAEWLENIRKESHSIYRSGVVEATTELARYLVCHQEVAKARAIMGFVLEKTIEERLPDAFTEEMAEILDRADVTEEVKVEDVCREFGIVPGADPHVVAVLKELAEKAEKKKAPDLAEALYELLFDLTRNPEYQEKAAAQSAEDE
jgi:hypothetical protein